MIADRGAGMGFGGNILGFIVGSRLLHASSGGTAFRNGSAVQDGCDRIDLFATSYARRLTMQMGDWIFRVIGISGPFLGHIFMGQLYDDVLNLRLREALKLKKCIAKGGPYEPAEAPFARSSAGRCVTASEVQDEDDEAKN